MISTDYLTDSGETITVPTPITAYASPLLGLVSGHWPIPERVRSGSDKSVHGVININSGIALVTPAHHIAELLARDDVVERKDNWADQRMAEA